MLHQLSAGARGFETIAIAGVDALASDVRWVDAVDPDEAEMSAATRILGLTAPVLEWLSDPNRSTRPRRIADAMTFALAVPTFDGSAAPSVSVSTIVVAIAESRLLTAHDQAGERSVVYAARRVAGRSPGDQPHAAVWCLVDEIIERYDDIVSEIGGRQEAHATEILKKSDRRRSPNDVVAEGLCLAMSISDVQRHLRRLRQTLGALRAMSAGSDAASSLADSLDARSRALDGLNTDLDSMNHRLELTTDAQLSLLSWRQGDINKTIGAWAGVFAVNAVITGFYGMNIKGLPGDESWVTVAIIMASVSVALIAFFHRIDWL